MVPRPSGVRFHQTRELATGRTALGNQASEQQLREIVDAAGFSRFRRATETPFNRVFEAQQ